MKRTDRLIGVMAKQAQQNTLLGAGLGTAAGAGIGALTGRRGNRRRRALAGGLMGGVAGAAAGRGADEIFGLRNELDLKNQQIAELQRVRDRSGGSGSSGIENAQAQVGGVREQVNDMREQVTQSTEQLDQLKNRVIPILRTVNVLGEEVTRSGVPDRHLVSGDRATRDRAIRSQAANEMARGILARARDMPEDQVHNLLTYGSDGRADRPAQFDRVSEIMHTTQTPAARRAVERYNTLRHTHSTEDILGNERLMPANAREFIRKLIRDGIITAGTQTPDRSNYA